MSAELYGDGIDGIHGLRKRERTRLWYRAMPPVDTVPDHLRQAIAHAGLTVVAPALVEAARVHPVDPDVAGGTDTLVSYWPELDRLAADLARVDDGPGDSAPSPIERQERIRRRLGSQHNIEPAPVTANPAEIEAEPLTDWRTVPAKAPILLLAATELLDGRSPGPILAPGLRYRVLSAEHGVAGLQVKDREGATAIGYCNAVDLACIEPMLVTLAGGDWKSSTKQRLRRVSQSISTVTGNLIGAV